MLKKSRVSAVVMAIIALLSTGVTYTVIHELFSATSVLGAVFKADLFTGTELAVASGVALLVALVVVIIVAFVIYRLDDSHFGWRGACLWIVFGVLFALLLLLRSQILPSPASADSVAFDLLYRALRELFGLAVLLFSYWLVFKLLARLLGWDASSK